MPLLYPSRTAVLCSVVHSSGDALGILDARATSAAARALAKVGETKDWACNPAECNEDKSEGWGSVMVYRERAVGH